jgi:hypothetical protein
MEGFSITIKEVVEDNNQLINYWAWSVRLWRQYNNITIAIPDIIHRQFFDLKLNSIGLSVPYR